MGTHVAIGEFSRLTYLTVKTLRHYHEVGLLEPASVDESTGYRRYGIDQVTDAHLIRRLRALDMPVPQVRDVLAAAEPSARDAAIRKHLDHMEAELARTRSVVLSLRELLTPSAPVPVSYRQIEHQTVLAATEVVTRDRVEEWCEEIFAGLSAEAAQRGAAAPGPFGATYAPAFFEEDAGEVTAFVPVTGSAGPRARRLPGGWFAVAEHVGPYEEFDRTYGALGSHVAELGTGLPEPIRELYVVGSAETDDPNHYRTEICWPLAAGSH